MKYTTLTLGKTHFVIGKVTRNIVNVYEHRTYGCIYMGSWEAGELETVLGTIYAKMIRREVCHV